MRPDPESLFFILPKFEAGEAVRLTRSSDVIRWEDGIVFKLLIDVALDKYPSSSLLELSAAEHPLTTTEAGTL